MLWRVKHLESRRVQADYTSAGLGRPTVTQLVADGEVIANAVHGDTWIEGSAQVIGCASCGTERCEPGGWVSPRRAGSDVLWLPAFAEMAESDDALTEYRPPAYVTRRGIPIFDHAMLAGLLGAAMVRDLRPLRSDELALAMQWTAPGEILGVFPGPVAVREADALAVSSGERGARLEELAALLAVALRSPTPVELRGLGEGDEPVVFYLDTPGNPAWSPLASVDGESRLHFEGVGVVARSADSPP